MENKTITLKSPVQHNSHDYTTLTMREPKVRDSVNSRKQGGTDAEVEIALLANLCEVPPEVVEEMGMRDYKELQRTYESFLA